MGRFPIAIVAIAALAWSAVAAAEPADTPAAVARQFYDLYAAGRADDLMALWAPASPEREAFHRSVAILFRARCLTLHRLTIERESVGGDEATVELEALLSKSGRTMSERFDPQHAAIRMTRIGRRWMVTGWHLQEEALADELAAARSDAGAQAILCRNERLVTPALIRILNLRALLLINRGEIEGAARLGRIVTEAATRTEDLAGLSLARGIESIVVRRRPNPDVDGSMRMAVESAELAEESGDPYAIVRAQLRIGRAEELRHGAVVNKEPFERALALRDDVEDLAIVSLAAGQIAHWYAVNLDHRTELYYAELARSMAEADGDLAARYSAEMNIGGSYLGVNDYPTALLHHERALAIQEPLQSIDQPDLYWKIAASHRGMGHDREFLRAIGKGLAAAGKNNDEEAALLHADRGAYYVQHGDLRRAEGDIREAVRLSASTRMTFIRSIALTNLAELRTAQHRDDEALAAARAAGGNSSVGARVFRRLGRRKEAYAALRSLLASVEQERDKIADERQRLVFLQARIDVYQTLIDMLLEDGRVGEALAVAEESKGRSLLDVLRGGRSVEEEAISGEDRARQQEIESRITRLNERIASAGGTPEEDREALRQAREELEQLHVTLSAKYGRVVPQDRAAVTPAQMAALLPGTSAAFVEYVLSGRRLHIFVVRRDARGVRIRCRTVTASRARLAAAVHSVTAALAQRDLGYGRPARKAYDLLLAPVQSELHGVTVAGIIPDGPLWRLPFESLLMPDGRFVLEKIACFYAPSITVYREMSRRERGPRPAGAFLAFANPPSPSPRSEATAAKLRSTEYGPLPEAEREVAEAAALYRGRPTRVYVGAAALEARAKSESRDFDVIHFATHAVLDDSNPMFSHLLLAGPPADPSNDGLLETWEMMRLHLHADLAVLSACETGGGRVGDGEGMIGMSWALFVAGCSSTIATQWKVSSAPTAELMVSFYREWLHGPGGPFAKAEALRRARLGLLHGRDHHHPFYWSGFVLIGAAS